MTDNGRKPSQEQGPYNRNSRRCSLSHDDQYDRGNPSYLDRHDTDGRRYDEQRQSALRLSRDCDYDRDRQRGLPRRKDGRGTDYYSMPESGGSDGVSKLHGGTGRYQHHHEAGNPRRVSTGERPQYMSTLYEDRCPPKILIHTPDILSDYPRYLTRPGNSACQMDPMQPYCFQEEPQSFNRIQTSSQDYYSDGGARGRNISTSRELIETFYPTQTTGTTIKNDFATRGVSRNSNFIRSSIDEYPLTEFDNNQRYQDSHTVVGGFNSVNVGQHLSSGDNSGQPKLERKISKIHDLMVQLPSQNLRKISLNARKNQQQNQPQNSEPQQEQVAWPTVGFTPSPDISGDGDQAAEADVHHLRDVPAPLECRRLRRRELVKLQNVLQPPSHVVTSVSMARSASHRTAAAFQSLNLFAVLKKKVAAEAGGSVAAVFDLTHDLFRLDLFLAVLMLTSVVIPSLVWKDGRPASNGLKAVKVLDLKGTQNFGSVVISTGDFGGRELQDINSNLVQGNSSFRGDFQNDTQLFYKIKSTRSADTAVEGTSPEWIISRRQHTNTKEPRSNITNVEVHDQFWGWGGHEYDGGDENDTTNLCSYLNISSENAQVHECSSAYISNSTAYANARTDFFTRILDLIQGTGFLERTAMFIGWYPTFLASAPSGYELHLAYTLTTMFAYAISIVYVVRAFGRWLRTRMEVFVFTDLYRNMIFKGWDFNIANESTAALEKKLFKIEVLSVQLEEDFQKQQQRQTSLEKRKLFLKRVVIHLVVTCLIFAGWTAIYYAVTRINGDTFWEQYAVTMIIGSLGFILPMIFFLLSQYEEYSSKNTLLLYILRNIFVRLISIVILAISEIGNQIQTHDSSDVCNADNRCWETRLAQHIYALIIFDTLLHFLLTFAVVGRQAIGKFLHPHRKMPSLIWEFLSNPEFDTAGQVLRIVHLQTLCWMGLVCSPLIPLLTVISFAIMEGLNGITVFVCKLRPSTVFRASRSSSTFIVALLIGLILSLLPSALVFSALEPSLGCTPFRGLHYPYEALVYEMCKAPTWIMSALFLVDSLVVVGVVLLLEVLALIYHLAHAVASKAQLKHYEHRLGVTARDKRRLLQQCRAA